jgi:predicted ArsR family transcriptional regulator
MIEAEAYRALSSRSRQDILRLLYRNSLSVEQIAQKLGLQPITIRHHLQSLVESGFVETIEERAGSVGRPKIYYKLVKEPPLVSYPRRGYLMLNNFLVSTLRSSFGENQARKLLRKVGLDMGDNTAKRLGMEYEVRDWTPKAFEQFFVRDYLENMGTEPEIVEVSDKKIVYRLHNCLFFEMAVKTPEIICDVLHESFHEGLAKTMNKDIKITHQACMAKDKPYCELSVEWQK